MKLKELVRQRWASYSIATCSAVILYMLLSHIGVFLSWVGSLWGIFSTIVIGLSIAYLLNPVANYFERTIFRKVKKPESRHACSVILTVGCVVILLVLMIMMVVPSITGSITGIINNYNTYYRNIQHLMNRINNSGQIQITQGLTIELSQISDYVNQLIRTVFGNLKNTLTSVMEKIGDIGSSVFNILIGFIIAVYVLSAKQNMKTALYRLRSALTEEEHIEAENQFWNRCNQIFIQYIGCSLLDACIVGIANALFMSICKMENITLISLIVGITNLLPTFGPLIGGLLGLIFLLLTKPIHALYFVIFTVILQALDGYIIKPKLFSDSLGISPVLTLISIILGGKMFGVLGIFLAIPVVAVAVMLYEEKFLPWLHKLKDARKAKAVPAESVEEIPEEEIADLTNPID